MHGQALIVTGVAASGKTTIAQALAERLDMECVDGDDYHPSGNIEKMRHNIPLNDSDRAGWLDTLAMVIHANQECLVLACSALKRAYRDVLRYKGDNKVMFVYLDVSRVVVVQRLTTRQHAILNGTALVESQFRDLEPPLEEEDVLCSVSVGLETTVDQVVEHIVERYKALKG
jgi:carbohydrate kinase (thermoresistant glucokinase family)